MRSPKSIRRTDSQRGVALLIAIFVLLIIGAVGVALILSSSTETSIAANYRTATQAFYAAKAGLEEGRGRLWTGSGANSIAATIAAGFTTVGTNPPALPVGRVYYITNPAAGEVVLPNVPGNAYFDGQYQTESNIPITAATVTPIVASALPAGMVGPLYKWVRISATTEWSTKHDVNKDGFIDKVTPLFYDGTQQFLANQIPPTIAIVPKQVFTVTALAVTPSGSTRMLEYTTAMTIFNFQFPAALTLNGKNPNYQKPTSVPFVVQGNYPPPNGTASCPVPPASLPAVGVVGGTSSINAVVNDIQQNPDRSAEYTGGGLTTPSVADVTGNLPTTESSPSQLEALVAQIESTANYVIQGPVTSLTPAQLGTAANPVTVVIDSPNNGATANLSLSGNVTGYGILVVRGTYSPAGTVGWNGIVLVIGQGDIQGSGGGNNSYNGAVFVANTRDSSGNILNNLGTPIFNWSGGGGNGIAYNPCTINNATQNQSYQVLSFREIPD
jgi:PilX N-terminal